MLLLSTLLACALADEPTYMDRPIAEPMSWRGGQWLLRPSREAEEDPGKLLKLMKLEPGMTVCELGAGNGYHTLKLAQAVGPEGHVYANDLQPQMLDWLTDRAQAAELDNITTVLGTEAKSQLPEGACARILMVDVYHELASPPAMLEHLKSTLAEDGWLVIIEFRGEDPELAIKPDHKMTKDQVIRELEANGYTLRRQSGALPIQHFLAFTAE